MSAMSAIYSVGCRFLGRLACLLCPPCPPFRPFSLFFFSLLFKRNNRRNGGHGRHEQTIRLPLFRLSWNTARRSTWQLCIDGL